MELKGERAAVRHSGQKPELNPVEQMTLAEWSEREVCGLSGMAVKCIELTQTSDCAGSMQALNCRSGTKA